MSSRLAIWTVGHSNHEPDRFARLVSAEQIEFLVDVRSYPYSRFAPHFNRDELEAAMRRLGVRYLFLGDELGVALRGMSTTTPRVTHCMG